MDKLTKEQSELVEQNMNIVYDIYKGFNSATNKHYREDILQEGYIGLCKAVITYNPEYGFAFSTYAYKVIKGFMLDSVKRELNKGNSPSITFADNFEAIDSGLHNDDGEGTCSYLDSLINCVSAENVALDNIVIEDSLNKESIIKTKDYSVVIKLKYDGYKQCEIAEMLNITVQRVSFILSRNKEDFKKHLSL